MGGVPNQVTAAAMAASLQIFLLDVVQVEVVLQTKTLPVRTFKSRCVPQMEAFYVSLVLFVSRAWDAVTDPLIGYLVGRSRWTGVGKLSPWLVGWWRRGSTLSKIQIPSVPSLHSADVCLAGWFCPLRLPSSPTCCCGSYLRGRRGPACRGSS